MHRSVFFKLFPPPKFLVMSYGGLDISDDAITFLAYKETPQGIIISGYDSLELPAGLIVDGEFKDEKKFTSILQEFRKKNSISRVRVSLPEEKAYLFETDVPIADARTLYHNIEFKLEQNVPLSAADAVFYFDLLPFKADAVSRASVSVVPRIYIENYIDLLGTAGIVPIAFEISAKAIARAIISVADKSSTQLIVHIMKNKTGLYVVSGGVITFTSTVAWGISNNTNDGQEASDVLGREIARVYSYWATRGDGHGRISKILLTGKNIAGIEVGLRNQKSKDIPDVSIGNAWVNTIDINTYVPSISERDSSGYAAASGLAIPPK